MPANATGFGVQPVGYGPAGVDVHEPLPGQPEEHIADDIHAIRKKYVDGGTNMRIPLQLVNANQVINQGMTGQEVNSVILTVTAGVVYGYLSDQSSNNGKAPVPPDFVVSAAIAPQSVQFVFPLSEDYWFSFQEGAGTTATAVARLLKVS